MWFQVSPMNFSGYLGKIKIAKVDFLGFQLDTILNIQTGTSVSPTIRAMKIACSFGLIKSGMTYYVPYNIISFVRNQKKPSIATELLPRNKAS